MKEKPLDSTETDEILYYEHENNSEPSYSDPEKTGLRSGKGTGFLRRIILD